MGIEVAQAYQNRKYQTTDKLTQKVISEIQNRRQKLENQVKYEEAPKKLKCLPREEKRNGSKIK